MSPASLVLILVSVTSSAVTTLAGWYLPDDQIVAQRLGGICFGGLRNCLRWEKLRAIFALTRDGLRPSTEQLT